MSLTVKNDDLTLLPPEADVDLEDENDDETDEVENLENQEETGDVEVTPENIRKMHQKEIDRQVTKGLKKYKSLEANMAKITRERDELLRKALTADELEARVTTERDIAMNAKQVELDDKEKALAALEYINDKGLPIESKDYLTSGDIDDIEERGEMLDILLNKMVDKELKLRMSKTGLAPEAGVARVTKMTKEQLLKLPDAALLKFANDHPLEYNRLLKS